jgi:hypothetical protein
MDTEMRRVKSILKWILIAWIFVVLTGMIAIGGLFFYRLSFGSREQADMASLPDVRFVLNLCQLGDARADRLVHSYQSTRSFSGGHFDAYKIKITNVNVEELTRTNADSSVAHWHRGDQLSGTVDGAVKFAGIWLNEDKVSWFPKESELRSGQIYVYPCHVDYLGDRPRAAQLIFVKPSENMVFYFDAKM